MARGCAVLGMIALFAAGCQQHAMVDVLPPPSFNGPTLADAPTERVTKIAPAPVVVAPPPAPVYTRPAVVTPAAPVGAAAWVPPVRANAWRWIVIHHSATASGGLAKFDREHRAKGWDELGYHFVIGNGTESGDGQVEIGPRWPKQKWGAHTKTPDNQYNDYGIGICLVGNFDETRPTAAQLRSLTKLVSYLAATYHVSSDHIIGHGMAKPTECPGRNLSIADIRRRTAAFAAAPSNDPIVHPTAQASLMHDLSSQ